MNLSIKFKDFHPVGDHIEYTIEVTNTFNSEIWKFQRRYSDLRNFFTQIKATADPPHKFPPKKVFGNKNPRFLEHRKTELELYFSDLLKVPTFLSTSACGNFFMPLDREIINSATAAVAKPSTPAVKKSRVELEVKITSQKVTEALPGKLFDMSIQPLPMEDEERKMKTKHYAEISGEIKIEWLAKWKNKNREENIGMEKVEKQEWINRAFANVLANLPEPVGYTVSGFLE